MVPPSNIRASRLCFTLLACVLFAVGGAARQPASASVADLAGTDPLFAPAGRGAGAVAQNPAVLAARPVRCVELLGLDAAVGNSSLSMQQYARLNGAAWDEADENEFLDSVEGTSLDVTGHGSMRAASVTWGQWAVGSRTRGSTVASIPAEALDLLLYGNTVGESFTLDEAACEAMLFTEWRVSVGYDLGLLFEHLPPTLQEWSGGVSLKLLQGWQHAAIAETRGSVTTTEEVVYGDGYLRTVTAQGGQGFAADVGFCGSLGRGWTGSIAVRDLFGGIIWNQQAEERIDIFMIPGATLGDGGEAIIGSETVTRPLEEIRTSLPTHFHAALARTGPHALTAVRVEAASADRLGGSRTPRVEGGHARRLTSWLVLRASASVGGLDRATLGAGIGVAAGPAQFDAHLRSWGSLDPLSSQGLGLGCSIVIAF